LAEPLFLLQADLPHSCPTFFVFNACFLHGKRWFGGNKEAGVFSIFHTRLYTGGGVLLA
jgi:hypothetical protein